MAFIPTPNGALAVIRFAHGGFAVSNNYWFVKAGFDQTAQENLAGVLDALHTAELWAGAYNTDYAYVQTDVYDMRTLTGQKVTVATNARAGTVAGEILPVNLAIVVTLRTAARGRSGRGRVYLTGFGETAIADGLWGQANADFCKDYVDDIADAATGQGWTMVIRSTQENGVVLEEANTRPVTTTVVRSLIPGTQRRRLDRP